jgi:hypothetical protein
MKQIIIGCAIAITILSACDNSGTSTTTKTADTITAAPTAPAATAVYAPPAGVDARVSASVKEIINGYLSVKNFLAQDDAKNAAAAGQQILTALEKVDQSAMTPDQKKKYTDLADDIKEMAEHISTNGGKIAHQREHFEMLSKDVEDLVRIFGGGQPLYKDFCPMANDSKGASWLSETKEIKNPYMGKEMPGCGEVKEELK